MKSLLNKIKQTDQFNNGNNFLLIKFIFTYFKYLSTFVIILYVLIKRFLYFMKYFKRNMLLTFIFFQVKYNTTIYFIIIINLRVVLVVLSYWYSLFKKTFNTLDKRSH